VRFFDVITKIDLSVTVGIVISEDIKGDTVDIFTIPSSITSSNGIWARTIEVFRIWAVFISPIVFTNNDAIEDFTSIKRLVTVIVTFG